MSSSKSLLIAAGLCSVLLLGWWLWPRAQEMLPARGAEPEAARPRPPEAAAPSQPGSRAEPSQPGPAPRNDTPAKPSETPDDHEHAPAPTSDLDLYRKRPMSAVPHRVLQGWGASPGAQVVGMVGATVIVEPGISDAQLVALCRDIQKYHADAKTLSVRILDSEEAASYDRHIDGGALRDKHQVARVIRDPALRVDEIHVRGERLTP
jgi:hypothetical protein